MDPLDPLDPLAQASRLGIEVEYVDARGKPRRVSAPVIETSIITMIIASMASGCHGRDPLLLTTLPRNASRQP